jgi:hypothetical protein
LKCVKYILDVNIEGIDRGNNDEDAWSKAKNQTKKLTEEEERAKLVREETKKLMKELKGSKQKEKEEDIEKKRNEVCLYFIFLFILSPFFSNLNRLGSKTTSSKPTR